MSIRFKNPNGHAVQLIGPNKEIIKVSAHQEITLPDYYIKYSPKHIVVSPTHQQPERPISVVAQQLSPPRPHTIRSPTNRHIVTRNKS
jgi:hypothetical protein